MSRESVEFELLVEVRTLALEMLRLDQWAKDAYKRQNFIRVGELHTQREQVRERRSMLMRDIWNARHRSRKVVAVV